MLGTGAGIGNHFFENPEPDLGKMARFRNTGDINRHVWLDTGTG
jgi:hypothetical protein